MLVGGVLLFVSLFLTWSHQLPSSVLSAAGSSPGLRGVPANPTAWQVYSIADALLALLAVGLVTVALAGRSPGARIAVLLAAAIALAFVAHALSSPPTNGVLLLNPVASSPQYLHPAATAGAGETVALVAMALAAAGLLVGLATD
ncbi:MAG TPA: hypothetical protein VMP89_13300 [Solirubrobacteraceae bacterium]|nr:hypothetical protein [Solirubrobacteraceae bacterium]